MAAISEAVYHSRPWVVPFGGQAMGQRWITLIPVLAATICGSAALAPARADCASNCDTFNNPLTNPNWQTDRTNCKERCPREPSRMTAAYGALAYGTDSTAWGFSYRQSSAAAAERDALEKCKPNGDDCKVVYRFSNTCAALAAVEDKGVFATADARSKGGAEEAAMAACTRQNGDGCVLEVSTCSLP
ncbi:MAG TPA: DUF4189 domain-containing protein [Stellaceae bacterium]|nr:DUF4189 domain-containing protein [Stellaceae bacterium]